MLSRSWTWETRGDPGWIVVGAVMLSPSLLVPTVTLWVFPGWPSLYQEAPRARDNGARPQDQCLESI